MVALTAPTDTQIHREFEKMLPELSSRFRCRFLSNGPDLQNERAAEAIALSWQTYQSARQRGKTVTPSTIAWYTIKAVLSGRRLAGSTSLDAMSETGVARERIGAHISLSEVGENAQDFYRVFGDRRCRWPVIDLVGTRLDWESFLNRCDQRDRRIVEMKLDGCPQIEIADNLGISPAAVCQRLQAIRQRWNCSMRHGTAPQTQRIA